MSDRQTTPSPGIHPPENETAQATQVIRTTDATRLIPTPDPSDTLNLAGATDATDATYVTEADEATGVTDPTQVVSTSEAGTDGTDGTGSATRAAVRAAEQAQATAQKARSKAGRPWFKKKRFALPSAVIAVFAVIMVTTGGNDSGLFRAVTNAAQPTTGASLKTLPATATLGQSVRDGTFAFTVTEIQRPAKSFTDRTGTTQSAQGVFLVVRVNVTNIGYRSRTLNATDLFLIDAAGRRFATSSAISSMPGAERVLLQKINPGQTINNAPVLFDVAPGTLAANIELHESMTSPGVQVKLP